MAVNIGPKIGIDGEAEYRKSLNNIIQQQKTLKAEMEATSTAFDKNATAQDKAKAKAENLTKQIDNQRTRVEKLKEMVQASAEKYGEADTKTLKWKEALANATTELNGMEAELADVNAELNKDDTTSRWEGVKTAITNAGTSMTEFGEGLKDVGDNVTKYVTTPIVAAATAAVAAFKSTDSGYDTIIKKTGATGDAYDDLKEQANDLYTSMNVSLDDVGAAIGEVNTRFGLAGDEAEATSRAFLEFAQVNDTDVSASVDTVQNALAAFNMDASDASTILDVLTKTGQNTGASVESMAENLVENATALQQMGLDAYQAIDFMGRFEVAGADSNAVLSGMKRALKEATEEGVPFDEALADLEDTIVNGTDDMDGLTAAYDLFGKSGAAVYQAVANGQISFTDFADSADILNESLGSTNETYEATLDPLDEVGTAMNRAKVAGANIAATLLTMAVPAIEAVSNAVQTATQWWNGLDDGQKNTIITIAGIVAAVGPLLSVVGSVITAVGMATVAFGALNISLAPIIGIVLGVVAAVAAVILIIKHWGEITEWLSATWEKVKTSISNAVTLVQLKITVAWNKIKKITTTVWNSIKTFISTAWNNIKTTVKNAITSVQLKITAIWNKIKTATTNAWNAVKTFITTTWDNIKTAITTALTNVKTAITDAWNNVKTTISDTMENIKEKISTAWENVKTTVTNAIESVKTTLSNIWETIKTTVTDTWDSIITTITDTWETIKTTVSDAVNNVWDSISTAFTGAWETVTDIFNGIWESISTPLTNAWDTVSTTMTNIWSTISTTLTNAWDSVSTIFGNIYNSIYDKIWGAYYTVSDAISWIRGLFNFEWSFPSIKLPHFSWSWIDLGGIVSIPSISVDWYKKAYTDPMMFTSPTVLGTAGGMKGFGDGHGGEIVIGQSMMYGMIKDAVSEGGGAHNTWGDINVVVNGAEGQDVRELADVVADRIAERIQRRKAVWA